jgi:hypothetical protein
MYEAHHAKEAYFQKSQVNHHQSIYQGILSLNVAISLLLESHTLAETLPYQIKFLLDKSMIASTKH